MENTSYQKYLGYIAAFALGTIAYRLFIRPQSGSASEGDSDPKKVKFDTDTLQHEDVKDIIELAVKETIRKYEGQTPIKLDKGHSKKPTNVADKSRRRYSESDEPIYKICFTGGPCAGKTTALSLLMAQVEQLGFRSFLVPEAATLLMKAGFLIDNTEFTETDAILFQSSLMKTQIFLEDVTTDYAGGTSNKPVVIFCDRGLMDGKAYVSETVWQGIMDENNWNEIYLRDSRYDAVIHMVTAADGADQFYDLDTNEARYENIELAREVDKKLQKNWSGHSQLYLIDNNAPSFDEKTSKAVRTVLNLLGFPQSNIFNRKFLIYPYKNEKITVPYEEFQVQETFLTGPKTTQSKLIKKGALQSYNYTLEVKEFVEDQTLTKRRQISAREFLNFAQER